MSWWPSLCLKKDRCERETYKKVCNYCKKQLDEISNFAPLFFIPFQQLSKAATET